MSIFIAPHNDIKIYVLVDADEQPKYVGQTRRTPEIRLAQHRSYAASGGGHGVHQWMRLASVVRVKTLEVCEGQEAANVAEKRWIAFYRALGFDLLNIRDGGQSGSRFSLTAEQRAKISEANRRREHSHVIVRHTPEGIARMRAANQRPKTDAEKQAMREAARHRAKDPRVRSELIARLVRPGQPLSDTAKKKISAASKGKPKTDATRERMRLAWIIRRGKAA